MLTPDETEALEILTRLPQLILEYEALPSFSFTWGCKRRRSAIDVTPSPSSLRLRLRLPHLKTPSPLRSVTNAGGGGGGVPTSDADSLPLGKADASSPATPLSFSPSESDEKPVVLKRKIPLKRKRDDYFKKIEELTKSTQLLRGEVDNVKRYYDDLKAYNLKLKARQEELRVGPKREAPCMEISLQIVDASVNSSSMAENQDPDQLHHHGQQIGGHMSESGQPTTSFPSTSVSSMANNTSMGPLGIPDLNVSLDESIPLDFSQPFDQDRRVMAAQARQKRIMINRVKNIMGINKPRNSIR